MKVHFITLVIFSNYVLYTTNQENTKHIHGLTDTCAYVHFPPAHRCCHQDHLVTVLVTEPQLLYLESEFKNLHLKIQFLSENTKDGKTFY